ncbi:MAG: YgiT-type zinc finger protein [Anaerolineaceae bacterium]|jgi:YgiT-type zinc finger domain-containing protein|nr:YgiT-type zinc finger protein [Anaerolineaceae bacterium]
MRRSLQKSKVFCPACQVGNYHLKLVTYYAWHKNDLITVPDFPSWVCDVCSRIEYDEKAVNQLRTLLASSTDVRVVEKARKKPKAIQATAKNRRIHKSNNNQ